MGQEDLSKGLIPRICDALFEKIAEVSDLSHGLCDQSHNLHDEPRERCRDSHFSCL